MLSEAHVQLFFSNHMCICIKYIASTFVRDIIEDLANLTFTT